MDVCEAAGCAPANLDWGCCSSSSPCADGEGDCDYDSDCLSGNCSHDVGSSYGVSWSFDVCEQGCSPANMDWGCCSSSNTCAAGEGDCDYDSDCSTGYCAHDVGSAYGASWSFDVCEAAPACAPTNLDWSCCSSSSPCADGEGDCDADYDCMSGYCAHDVGSSYGGSWGFDVCEQAPPTPYPVAAPASCDPSLLDWSCCTYTFPCANGDGGCDSVNMDWGCCSSSNMCAQGEGDCDYDSDCLTGYCGMNNGLNYGATTSFDVCDILSACDPSNLDWSCCTYSSPCAAGDGDCDSDSDCMAGTACSHDVGSSYGVTWSFDVCEASGCAPANLDWGCCTYSSPCANGEGDCDSDSDCISGYCSHDVGSDYGVSWGCCSTSSPCAVGEGDCDYDSDCLTGYCAHDV